MGGAQQSSTCGLSLPLRLICIFNATMPRPQEPKATTIANVGEFCTVTAERYEITDVHISPIKAGTLMTDERIQ